MEKKNHDIKHIQCILTDNNDIITDPKQILKEEYNFYQTLYTKPNEEINEENLNVFIKNPNIKKLCLESSLLCDENITLKECALALKAMYNNKAPGSDGFPAEFYKVFWPNIKEIILQNFQYAFTSHKLSIEQRRGILSLIPKKGSDLRKLKSWRPLTLLNTDYKILAKVLATRLQNVIDEIVAHDQNGYVKNIFIGENIRTIKDMIEYCNLAKELGILVLIYFEKAFDTVSWSFLLQL